MEYITLAVIEYHFRWPKTMKNPISIGVLTGSVVLSLIGISFIGYSSYTGRLAWASTSKTIILKAKYTEPQITSIQFDAEIVKFLVLNNRLHLLMPLPITGLSATIVDIRAAMKKVRK